MAPTTRISAAEWQILAQKRVVFAHQSVGQNILDGVQSLAAQNGAQLPVLESRGTATTGGVIHFFVGQNEDPLSKFRDFEKTLEEGAAKGADVALMKLCYIDFKGDTDARLLAEQYIATLDRLSQRFPNTVFGAITAPLTTVQTGPKAWVKRLLGREPSGYVENARRQEFNNVIRARFAHSGVLFDLAKVEAEGSGSYQYEGRPIEVLNPSLTNDGGHLNAGGEQIVATRLIRFLAALPSGH